MLKKKEVTEKKIRKIPPITPLGYLHHECGGGYAFLWGGGQGGPGTCIPPLPVYKNEIMLKHSFIISFFT